MTRKRIAILFHAKQERPQKFVIHHLAKFWQDDGHEVKYIFGFRKFIPADILIVHVDLSIIPDAYIEFAEQYPIVLNGKLKNICKSQVSSNLLSPDDSWKGKVILKSNFNFHGLPEKVFAQSWLEKKVVLIQRMRDIYRKIRHYGIPLDEARSYKIFNSLDDIPKRWFTCREIVVEKFLPELENGFYNLRIAQVFGERCKSTLLSASDPVIKAHKSIRAEEIEPHPIVKSWCRNFNLDYGKIDFIISDNKPVLLDINKTVGATSGYRVDNELVESRRYLAGGIYSFLQ